MKKHNLLSLLIIILVSIIVIQCDTVNDIQNELQKVVVALDNNRLGIDIPKIKNKSYEQLSIKLNDNLYFEMDDIQTLSAKSTGSNEQMKQVEARFIVITDTDTLRHEVDTPLQRPGSAVYIETQDTTLLKSDYADHTLVSVLSRTTDNGTKVITLVDGTVLRIGNASDATYIELDAAYIEKSTNVSTPVER